MTKEAGIVAGLMVAGAVCVAGMVVGDIFIKDKREESMTPDEVIASQVEETRDKTRTLYYWASAAIIGTAITVISDIILDKTE